MTKADFGVVGLGTMGRNLALNVESRGFRVAVWNREQERTDAFIAGQTGHGFIGTASLEQLVEALARPRRILLMIPAGKPVDDMIDRLRPLLETGDVLVDGGNSWYLDTRRRESALRGSGLHFAGCGVSGGEDGARHGPSLMPGGSVESWTALRDVLEAIAARAEGGPCVTHVGPDGAGHFVKMVHNGIEYGDMQIIAESWDVMRRGLSMTAAETAGVWAKWNEGPLQSFLVELSAEVCMVMDPETGQPLVDVVLDKAGQKGTGRWTAQVALELGVAIPTIAAATDARVLSSLKDERVRAGGILRGPETGMPHADREAVLNDLHDALFASRVCSYAQGMALIAAASREYSWNIDLSEVCRIWTGGCIIRARLLGAARGAFQADPHLPNLLIAPEISPAVMAADGGWRRTLQRGLGAGLPMPAHAAALAYFDAYRSPRLPQNLTQAQRDAFGAHTYERIDRAGPQHSSWE
ncbi:MAG TPA: NADP-dependent phosphogluconate dehydrogenase [Vicinamibacterales bacterium]|nr:NADP-dependent phosphogluconate dehydrogenase [Vicinamibacterales bacterium]